MINAMHPEGVKHLTAPKGVLHSITPEEVMISITPKRVMNIFLRKESHKANLAENNLATCE